MIARESGADGVLAPRWCDVETIARWACETSELDVRDALGKLQTEGLVTGSLRDGLAIDPEIWSDYVNERLRKRLKRERTVRDEIAPAATAGPTSCGQCKDGMLYRDDGRFERCCSCPRGRELARAVYATRQGERDSAARRSADTARRSEKPAPTPIQHELDGMLRRRKAGGE
jgi:hypothetical protein